MSKFFELDKTTLNKFDYHWLWGLHYSKSLKKSNIGLEVEALMQDENKLTQLIEYQRIPHQHSSIRRFFYWLFNINNYAFNDYLLVFYHAHQKYLFRSHEEVPTMVLIKEIPDFVIEKALSLRRALARVTGIFTQEETNTLVPREKPVLRHESSGNMVRNVESFKITAEMVPHLAILGIHLRAGDMLNMSAFKSKCKACFRASHPDKGGTDAAFRQMKEAAEQVIKMQFASANALNRQSVSDAEKYWVNFYNNIADRMNAAADRMNAAADRMNAAADSMNADAERLEAACQQLGTEIQALQAQVEELEQAVEAPASPSRVSAANHGLFSSSSRQNESEEEMDASRSATPEPGGNAS